MINSLNIDSMLSLSNKHSWLDGFGTIDTALWNPEGDKLMIRLSTIASPPTISIGDTITPDSSKIKSVAGIPCYNSVILRGSFNPSGIGKNTISMFQNPKFIKIYPNPFLSNLSINYEIDKRSIVNISVFDKTGRLLRKLLKKRQAPNIYTLTWDGTDNTGKELSSGIYFIRFEAGKYKETKKVVILRFHPIHLVQPFSILLVQSSIM